MDDTSSPFFKETLEVKEPTTQVYVSKVSNVR